MDERLIIFKNSKNEIVGATQVILGDDDFKVFSEIRSANPQPKTAYAAGPYGIIFLGNVDEFTPGKDAISLLLANESKLIQEDAAFSDIADVLGIDNYTYNDVVNVVRDLIK